MAYRERSDFGRGGRDEEFRNRGNEEWRNESGRQFGRDFEESGRYGRGQRTFGSEGFGYGQHGGYSEEGGYDPQRRQGAQPEPGMGPNFKSSVGWGGEGYRRYGESYGRGPEGMDRETGSYGGYGPTYGSRYGSEFGRATSEFGPSYGDTQSTRGRFTGRGPKGYTRSDDRIREDVSDRLEQHGEIDASEIEVRVASGEVTLNGTVDDRRAKRLAEDIIESCPGVKQVHNQIRVQGNGGERERSFEKASSSSSPSGRTGSSTSRTTSQS
jgi:BON domain-containing protein